MKTAEAGSSRVPDNSGLFCTGKDSAFLPFNRCNLPARIIGSLSFQQHPVPLLLDGVETLHRSLFTHLNGLPDAAARAQRFMDYMTVHFCLETLEEAGLEVGRKKKRANANYLRVLRGWAFDSSGREGAVLKGWVESRFGLAVQYHQGAYLSDRSSGLYGTNALESQLDLVYTYCQYELALSHSRQSHITLYRGVNALDEYRILQRNGKQAVVLLNNVSSFSTSRERADEFGDYIMEVQVPLSKVLAYDVLLPKLLRGEGEYLVVGGVYEVKYGT
ncbi:MAG: NAD(+)--dinitrogen-reductase ADP-D-ribosyltransferase [Thiothrix sp.]|uniref:NAD(+)--dinitrogen-reductase ADP-D-ribosyltransferase n=1 Tax=Thiothrix sp. TaxID=1032 RepID=UPI002638E0B7|nr:NAD(+)--dinitrogen-reductase ADP-D-ribosyltransferase [Thiothrix sp.]MDD5394352.1 NAD(+)--dinitrogen-reductase ADP-D-ribosyltransferase [Thiothrix sp.]